MSLEVGSDGGRGAEKGSCMLDGRGGVPVLNVIPDPAVAHLKCMLKGGVCVFVFVFLPPLAFHSGGGSSLL